MHINRCTNLYLLKIAKNLFVVTACFTALSQISCYHNFSYANP